MGLRQVGMADLQDDAVAPSSIPHIEGINREIVALLQEDGRMPFSTIARTLGVSEGTVRSRVGQMHKANLIHFITVVNPLALGYTAWSMLGINVARGASADEVARATSVIVRRSSTSCASPRASTCWPKWCAARPTSCAISSMPIATVRTTSPQVEPMMGLGLYKSLFKWDKPLGAGNGRGKTDPTQRAIAANTLEARGDNPP